MPMSLIGRVCAVKETYLSGLTPFHASMIWSYVMVNDLFYKANPNLLLPQNIWFTPLFPFLDRSWCLVSVNSILDLPLDSDNKLDINELAGLLAQKPSQIYMRCCALQKAHTS